MVMAVEESSKSPLFESMDGNEQVGGKGVAFEEPHEGPANDIVVVESFNEEWQYPTREQQPIEWWKNHFLPQHNEEHANVAIFEGPLNYAKQLGIINMWNLMGNARTSLCRVEKLRNSRVLQVFDHSQSGCVEGGALECS